MTSWVMTKDNANPLTCLVILMSVTCQGQGRGLVRCVWGIDAVRFKLYTLLISQAHVKESRHGYSFQYNISIEDIDIYFS